MKHTLLDCQEWALERGGVCTSYSFKNMRSKMTWKCNNNHEWEMSAEKIKKGTWCKICLENQFKLLMTRAVLHYWIQHNQLPNP